MNTFISKEKNDNFAFLRGMDLQQLLVETENYLLEYRKKLDLPNNVTFGIEIEYENVYKKNVDKFIKNNLNGWDSKDDDSLNFGGEITSPIMVDKIEYWQNLKIVCEYLSKKKANTSNNAGGHIHIGTCVLGNDIEAWRTFLKLYTIYENVIFRFIYGDKISGRKKIFKYAPPVADSIYSIMPSIDRANSLTDIHCTLLTEYTLLISKYAALSFWHVNFNYPENTVNKNTLEFRSPNATTNAVIWQNNINAFTKMLVASKDKVMDEEFLDYKLKYEYLPYLGNEYMYNEINLKNVLEFVDLVFDNNLDKVYFLRQYLKNFQDNYGIKTAINAKKFVK